MKVAKRVLLLVMTLLLVCGMAVTASAARGGAKISARKAAICVKQSMTLQVTGTKAKVRWSSSNKKVAKVNAKGKVTGVKAGTATIKATVNKKTYSCKVTVKSSGLDQTKVTLEVGKTAKIKLYGTKIKSVSSNKKAVAVISKKGKITAKKAGSCVLTIVGKNGKKYKCKVTVTPKEEAETTPVEPQKVKTTGITLDKAAADMVVGQTAALTAAVAPENASEKTVTWTSSNPGVASVDANGTVTAVAVGDAQITAAAADGSGATAACAVSVLSQVASSPDQMALLGRAAAAGAPTVTIQSDAAATFTLPAGTYANTELIVNAPNGEVVNAAKFRQVTVQAIAPSTYVEQSGNLVVFQAARGRIRVEGQAAASIQVGAAGSQLTIENNGSLSQVTLNAAAQLTITGNKFTRIPVTAAAGAAGSVITTDKNLRLTAESRVSLVLNAGAEHTNAYVTNESNIPSVSGLGSVTVTNTATHDVESVVAEYNASVGNAGRTVTIRGRVINWANDAAMEGAALYLLRYSRQTDTENISQYLGGALGKVESDAEGMYSFANVPIGNYYLAACMDGMETSVQTLTVTSTAGETFNNGTIQLAPEGLGFGSIAGTVYDAYTGDPVDYAVTLKLRKGQGNLSGAALQTLTVSADAYGSFRFDNLRVGTYTIQALTAAGSAETIAATSDYVTVVADNVSQRNITVTRSLDLGEMRFVLRWNDEDSGAPSDLDSHLVGPAPGGGRFHTWYSDKEYYYDGLYDGLDHDDTEWEGPETTTIYHMMTGVYDFYVYDYSNQEILDSTEMSERSDAYVQVYFGDSADAYETYYIPKGQAGNLWHVCSYDSGTGILTTVNTVGYWPDDDGEGVGSGENVLDSLRGRLLSRINELQDICGGLQDGELRTRIQSALAEANSLYAGSSDASALIKKSAELSELIRQSKFAGATVIALDTPYTASVDMGDYLYYSYVPESDGTYQLDVTATSPSAEPWIVVYREGEFLSSSDGCLVKDLQAGVQYFFRISEEGDDGATYTVTLTRCPDTTDEQKQQLWLAIENLKSRCTILPEGNAYRDAVDKALAEADVLYAGAPAADELEAMTDRLNEYSDGIDLVKRLLDSIHEMEMLSGGLADEDPNRVVIQKLLEEASAVSGTSTDIVEIQDMYDRMWPYVEKLQAAEDLESRVKYVQDRYDDCIAAEILDETLKAELEAALADAETKLGGTLMTDEASELDAKMKSYAEQLDALLLRYDIANKAVTLSLDTSLTGTTSKENPFLYYTFQPEEDGAYRLRINTEANAYAVTPVLWLYTENTGDVSGVHVDEWTVYLSAGTQYTFKIALESMDSAASAGAECTVTLSREEDPDVPLSLAGLTALDDLSTIEPDGFLEIDLAEGEEASMPADSAADASAETEESLDASEISAADGSGEDVIDAAEDSWEEDTDAWFVE